MYLWLHLAAKGSLDPKFDPLIAETPQALA